MICLQEAHIIDRDYEQWQREWGGQMFFIPGKTASNGLILLIRRNLECSHITHEQFSERLQCATLTLQHFSFTIVNCYAPSNDKDKLLFLKELEHFIRDKNDVDNWVVTGDFNNVLDNDIDIVSGLPHDISTVRAFQDLVSSCELFDVWRLFHGDERDFSWTNNSPINWIARRLDYMLVNSTLFDKSVNCDLVTVEKSDHRGVLLEICLMKVDRGPSYWKFNDSLLKDRLYLDLMNEKLDLWSQALEGFPAQLKWDYFKIKIKEESIAYSRQKAMNKKDNLIKLRLRLKDLQKDLLVAHEKGEITEKDNLLEEMNNAKLALDLYALYEAKGAQTRSRIKWIEEGERNTKYFLQLEKSNQSNNTITSLKDKHGNVMFKMDEIMQIQVDYYTNLYTEKVIFNENNECDEFCSYINIPKISADQQETCEGMITEQEASYALKAMRNNSAPGLDGLTTSFYKVFWSKIKTFIINSYEEAFTNGQLSISQRRAVITLLHKGKGLPRDLLTNWRPISLTNTDYKILAKALALRLQSVIKVIVSEDQVGYIKGRNISTIIRIIDDTIELLKIRNETGAIVALDYTKAFDSVNKKFLSKVFDLFGFGPQFQSWVNVLTNGTESCINNAGWLSQFFPENSGIRQGCPFSPLAFILAVEILALKIRQSNNITGIQLPGAQRQCLKLLYADDITLFLKDRHDIEETISIINQFAKFSGLNMNLNKTEAMWLGADRHSQDRVGNLKWNLGNDATVKILGVIFSHSTMASEPLIKLIQY